MKINDNAIPDRSTVVARNAAIVARQKARTTDSRIRTMDPAHSQLSWKGRGRFRDTLLSAETTAHNPHMHGRAWVGNLTEELESLSATDRKTALDAMRKVLDDYAIMGAGPAGSHATVGDDPEALGSGASPEAVDAANKAFWDNANHHVTRDGHLPGDATQAEVQRMQRANDQYWHNATAHQRKG